MKKYLVTIVLLIILLLILLSSNVLASSIFDSIDVNNLDLSSIDESKAEELKNTLQNLSTKEYMTSDENPTLDMDAVIDAYKEVSEVVSNDEIATLIEDNKKELKKAGVDESLISTSSTLLKTFDADTVVDVVENDLNLDKLPESSSSSENTMEVVINNLSTFDKIKIAFKLMFAIEIVRWIFNCSIIIGIYSIVITGLIFKKAGKHGYATVIPLYRDIVHLKICNFSPWVLLLLLIPIIGWLALMAIAIISRFELSKSFGHGFLFGLGLLIFPIIFRSVIAFSNNEYIGDKVYE